MATPADWIKVELNPDQLADADAEALRRQMHPDIFPLGDIRRTYGSGAQALDFHRQGSSTEMAASLYRKGELPDWTRFFSERKRGNDGDGWEVRSGSNPAHRLPMNPSDRCEQYLFVLSHEMPVIWLVGWISKDAALAHMQPAPSAMKRHRYVIDQRFLNPLPEQNGFTRRGAARWLVDPQTPFWCEICGGMHPIIEHRDCR